MNEWITAILGVWLCIILWLAMYGGKTMAVLSQNKWDAEPTLADTWAAIKAGFIPGMNIMFAIGTCRLLWDVSKLSKDYEGVEDDRKYFNDFIRTLNEAEEQG